MGKIINIASRAINNLNLDTKLETIPKWLLICIILSVGYLSFVPNANEENYMQLAMQFFNPDWIFNSHNLTEFPGTRILYQYIIGFFLQFFSFETLTFLFRFILIFLVSIPLSKIYRKLKITNIQILLHLPILFLLNQSLFAGSWMFVSVEPKGFSYIFVLYALYYYMTKSFSKMVIFLLLGTYFHILVGAYVFIYFMASLFLFERKNNLSKLVRLAFIYIISIVPLLIYIKSSISLSVEYQPNASWIYTYFRTPHHTALFPSISYFYKTHFYGVFLSFIGLIFCINNHSRLKDKKVKLLNSFVIISLIGTLALVAVAIFDRTGVLLKYYLYRINTLSTFVLTLIISKWIFDVVKLKYHRSINLYIILLAILFLSRAGIPNAVHLTEYILGGENKSLNNVCEYIHKNTKRDDVIFSFEEDLTITRKCRRDRFVVYKFVPAEMCKIYDWYQRVLMKQKVLEDLNYLKEATKQYKINYVLSKHLIANTDYIQPVYSNNNYYLYKIQISN